MTKKGIYAIVVWVCLYAIVAGAADEATPGVRMMYTAQSGYQPDELQMLSRMFTELSGIEVEIDYVNYEEQYQRIAQAASEYDVISLDQIWLMDVIERKSIVPLDKYMTRSMREDMSLNVLKAFRYQKETWAFPFLVNVQMFYYNKKLLRGTLPEADTATASGSTGAATRATATIAPAIGFENPPKTLEEMVMQMLDLKEAGVVEYPWTDAWQQGEGLICEYTWLTNAFGGEVFDEDGRPVFDQEPGVKALEFMIMLLQKRLTNPEVLTNDEIAAKNTFMAGEAVFTTNWLFLEGFVDASATSEMAIGAIPASKTAKKKTVSVSSMQGLAMTESSQRKDAAWKWIEFLTSPLVQRAYRFEMPIWSSVQTSDDAVMLIPNLAVKLQQLENAQHRPKLVNYMEISDILQEHLSTALNTSLTQSVVALDVLTQAKQELEALQKADK